MFYHYEEIDYPENYPKDLLFEFESDEEVLAHLQEDIKHNEQYDVTYYLSEITEPKIEVQDNCVSLSYDEFRTVKTNSKTK